MTLLCGIYNFEMANLQFTDRPNDDSYQVYWFAAGYFAPECTLTSVVYDEKNVKVTGKILNEEGVGTNFKDNLEIVFHLVYNNGNYNLKSIVYEGDE